MIVKIELEGKDKYEDAIVILDEIRDKMESDYSEINSYKVE